MQSGIFIVRYRTVLVDAGMPMPALVFFMLMPSYDVLPGAEKRKELQLLQHMIEA
jgi:hypothetical protein